MDEWLKSFQELSDEELDEEYSRFEFSPYGFQDALCELAGPFGYFTYLKDGWRACRTCAHISRAKMRTKK